MPEYFLILCCLMVFSRWLHRQFKLQIFASRRHWLSFVVVTFVVGGLWDTLALSRGHWSFGDKFLIGWKLGLMPIEELVFFGVFPYSLLVLYKLLEKWTSRGQ